MPEEYTKNDQKIDRAQANRIEGQTSEITISDKLQSIHKDITSLNNIGTIAKTLKKDIPLSITLLTFIGGIIWFVSATSTKLDNLIGIVEKIDAKLEISIEKGDVNDGILNDKITGVIERTSTLEGFLKSLGLKL